MRLEDLPDLPLVLDEVLEATMALQRADFGYIQLLDDETATLMIVAHRGVGPDFLEHFESVDANDTSACGLALKTGRRILVEDVTTDPGYAPHRAIADATGFRGVLSTPLFERGTSKPIGMLTTLFRLPWRPKKEDLRIADLLARQAADMIFSRIVEQQLRDSDEHFRLALEAGKLGTWEWDAATHLIKADHTHQALFGLTPQDEPRPNEAYWAHMAPEEAEIGTQRAMDALERGTDIQLELPVQPSEGVTRWISIQGRPRHRGTGSIIGITRDITERRNAQEELELTREAFVQSQKMDAVGQLTGGVAHDFNNLLTPIVGALDLLQRKIAGSDPRTERLVVNALQSASRATLLVQRLLGFARRQTLSTGSVDVAALLDGMHDLLASSVGPMVELVTRHEADLPLALADPNQLELSILNLCVNARDAMPEGGLLTIVAEQAVVDPGTDLDLRPGLYVRLSVIDTGVGMDEQTLARAVEPFFSTKETGRGTGLGLSMVHGLAAQLGGAFALSSTPGKGTRADLYLPLSGAAAPIAAPPKPLPSPHPLRPLNLLLVDDEELVRIGTGEMLRDHGHHVIEAADGSQALALLADGAAFDAVVTDYKMPHMDGAQLAERIRAVRPDLPILLITGYTGSTDDSPDLPRLAKPFSQADLAEALANISPQDPKVVRLPRRDKG